MALSPLAGQLAGIPIRLHFTLLLFVGVMILDGRLLHAAGLVLFMVYVLGHEMGHALVSMRLGYRVGSILLTPLGGMAMVAIDPNKHRDEARIALAGPIFSFALSIIGLAIAALAHLLAPPTVAYMVFWLGFMPNLMLAAFNLLPAFPMDGGRILRAMLAPTRGIREATRIASTIGKAFAAVLAGIGIVLGHWVLVFIGLFVFLLARWEFMRISSPHPLARFFGTPPLQDVEPAFQLGPPPYARGSRAWHVLAADVADTATLLWEEITQPKRSTTE